MKKYQGDLSAVPRAYVFSEPLEPRPLHQGVRGADEEGLPCQTRPPSLDRTGQGDVRAFQAAEKSLKADGAIES